MQTLNSARKEKEPSSRRPRHGHRRVVVLFALLALGFVKEPCAADEAAEVRTALGPVPGGWFDVYLDDRLLHSLEDGRMGTPGLLRVEFPEGLELRGMSVRPAARSAGRFETVHLDGYVNARPIDGAAVAAGSLPAGETLTVGGVPFLLPRAGDADHVDVGVSWVRAGNVEGAISGSAHDMARWEGALDRDPARLQLRLRNGHYSRLHLLAAADSDAGSLPAISELPAVIISVERLTDCTLRRLLDLCMRHPDGHLLTHVPFEVRGF